MTAESLKEENSALYDEIFALGQNSAATDITILKAENTKLKEQATIREKSYKMGLFSEGEKMIAEGVSLSDALSKLIDLQSAGVKETNDLKGIFQKTAPKAAGQGTEADSTVVKTQEQAKAAVKAQNSELKGAALVKAARRAYPQVFVTNNPTIEEE